MVDSEIHKGSSTASQLFIDEEIDKHRENIIYGEPTFGQYIKHHQELLGSIRSMVGCYIQNLSDFLHIWIWLLEKLRSQSDT